jgi:DNA-binding transcriptional LysR family regulator
MRAFDPDLLRTLVAFADAGSLGQAASIVGRTPSAITAQMQRLEDSVGVALLEPAGRGRVLTEAGEQLVGHARRILAANSEAWLSLTGAAADGRVGLGLTQDFADADLPGLLNVFARSHPRVRIDLRVGRSSELSEQFKDGRIDVLIAMRREPGRDEIAVLREPMCWLAAQGGIAGASEELPLALLDPPCGFREAALHALEKEGRRFRIAATSPSLAGLRAAVRAGLAVTVRTSRWAGDGIAKAPARLRLPKLPQAEFSMRIRAGTNAAAETLAGLLAEGMKFER